MSDRVFWRTVNWVALVLVAVVLYAFIAGLRE
jgi:hypothetical protein